MQGRIPPSASTANVKFLFDAIDTDLDDLNRVFCLLSLHLATSRPYLPIVGRMHGDDTRFQKLNISHHEDVCRRNHLILLKIKQGSLNQSGHCDVQANKQK